MARARAELEATGYAKMRDELLGEFRDEILEVEGEELRSEAEQAVRNKPRMEAASKIVKKCGMRHI